MFLLQWSASVALSLPKHLGVRKLLLIKEPGKIFADSKATLDIMEADNSSALRDSELNCHNHEISTAQ